MYERDRQTDRPRNVNIDRSRRNRVRQRRPKSLRFAWVAKIVADKMMELWLRDDVLCDETSIISNQRNLNITRVLSRLMIWLRL